MERPRKVGARFTNTDIAPDEFVQPVIDSDFDAKRDRWAGYDPSQHKAIVEQYNRVEEAKRQLRAEKLGSGDNQVSFSCTVRRGFSGERLGICGISSGSLSEWIETNFTIYGTERTLRLKPLVIPWVDICEGSYFLFTTNGK